MDYVDSVDNEKAVTHTTHMGPPDSTTGYSYKDKKPKNKKRKPASLFVRLIDLY